LRHHVWTLRSEHAVDLTGYLQGDLPDAMRRKVKLPESQGASPLLFGVVFWGEGSNARHILRAERRNDQTRVVPQWLFLATAGVVEAG
jgi:hypothetical protein